MSLLIPLVQAQTVIGTICGIVILCFQIRAYSKHKQQFFTILAISSVLGLAATFISSAAYFFPVSDALATSLYKISVFPGILAYLLATFGSGRFFLAYDRKFFNK